MVYKNPVRLGVDQTGTARVEIRAITFDESATYAPAKKNDGTFLQAGAFSSKASAENLAGRLMDEHIQPVSVRRGGNLYKVWIGPYERESEIDAMARRVVELGFARPHKVNR